MRTVHPNVNVSYCVPNLSRTRLVVCGGEISRDSGELASPNYPEPYRPNKECVWLIRVERGFNVALSFTLFEVRPSIEILCSLKIRKLVHTLFFSYVYLECMTVWLLKMLNKWVLNWLLEGTCIVLYFSVLCAGGAAYCVSVWLRWGARRRWRACAAPAAPLRLSASKLCVQDIIYSTISTDTSIWSRKFPFLMHISGICIVLLLCWKLS